MNGDTGKELIRALTLPGIYNHPVGEITHLHTHASHVFLAGEFAYKIKKPVDLGFLDYTDLDQRRIYCETEVRLNRRLTSGIYLGVEAITRDGGTLTFNGSGAPEEYVIRGCRFWTVLSSRQDTGARTLQRIWRFWPWKWRLGGTDLTPFTFWAGMSVKHWTGNSWPWWISINPTVPWSR